MKINKDTASVLIFIFSIGLCFATLRNRIEELQETNKILFNRIINLEKFCIKKDV